jgi:hypothetical protein
LLFIPIAR